MKLSHINRKTFTWLVSVVLLVLAFVVVVLWSQARSPDVSTQPQEMQTLTGDIVCLPKKGDGPQTLECAFGLRTADGHYYALQHADSKALAETKSATVTGVLSPAAGAETYAITATIDVRTFQKIK